MWFSWLVLACVRGEPGESGSTHSGDTRESEPADDSGSPDSAGPTDSTVPTDSGTEPTEVGSRCGVGMVPVPSVAPVYCVDAYENSLVGGAAVSVPGALPAIGVTYDEAAAYCAAAVVVDEAGGSHGTKRLTDQAEWQDAGDGVYGDGGTYFPYGDTYVEGACYTLAADGSQVWDDVQPTGSLATCVSAYGVYDSVGNAWEWVDSGLFVDVAGWFAARESEGLVVSYAEDGRLHIDVGQARDFEFIAAGVQPRDIEVDADNYIRIPADHYGGGFGAGYLIPQGADLEAVTAPFLPAAIDYESPVDGYYPLYIRLEDDGYPVPAKRGCAYYTGLECGVEGYALEHTHDFAGTIGFRCAADPY